MRRLVEHLLKGGVHGIFVMGTTGEFALLSDEERRRGVEIVVDAVKGRVPVLAGASAESTKKALAAAEAATEAGADILVLSPTYYLPPTQREILVHFRTFLKHVDLPCVAYNIPWCHATSIAVETAAELLAMPGVIGMKDSSENWAFFQRLLPVKEEAGAVLFQGSEDNAAVSFLMGADGGVPGIGNVIPAHCVKIYEAAKRGEVKKVRELNARLQRVRRTYSLAPVRLILKYMLSLLGIGSGKGVQPSEALPREVKRTIEQTLRNEGFLD